MPTREQIYQALCDQGASLSPDEYFRLFVSIRGEIISSGDPWARSCGKRREEQFDYSPPQVAKIFCSLISIIGSHNTSATRLRNAGLNEASIYSALETFMTRQEYIDHLY